MNFLQFWDFIETCPYSPIDDKNPPCSGTGLVVPGNKPLPEAMLTKIHDAR